MTNEPALDWQLKNLGRYLMTLPTLKTSKDALEGGAQHDQDGVNSARCL